MTGSDRAEFAERHRRVRQRMEAEGFDALIAYANAKVRAPVRYLGNYFTRWVGAQTKSDGSYHWFGSCAVLFPLDGEAVLLTDQPWDIERAREVTVFERTDYADNFGVVLGDLIAERGYRRVGIDNWFIFPAVHYLALVERAPETAFEGTLLLEEVYRVKTPGEITYIRKAEQAAMKAVEVGFAAVAVGASEYEIALAAENALREFGELELGGNSIISAGPNTSTGSSLPTRERSRTVERGDWVLFDICPSYNGYAGDISRMIVAGDLDDLHPRLRDMYETTRRMSEEVLRAIRPGVTPRHLNELAAEVAADGGFGENKIGLLGHGIGLDIHDLPDYYFDDTPLEENVCITVEPCLLERGVAGTRIEDVVCVTADGCEVFSEALSRELAATGR